MKKLDKFYNSILAAQSGNLKASKIYKRVVYIIEKILVIAIGLLMLVMAFTFQEMKVSTRIIAFLLPVFILYIEFKLKDRLKKRKKSE